MKRRDVLIAFGPLAVAGIATLIFCGVYAYLFVFGTIFEFNVSTLDGPGPRWPFSVMYFSGVTFALAAPIGIAWAGVYIFAIKKRGRPRADKTTPTLNSAYGN